MLIIESKDYISLFPTHYNLENLNSIFVSFSQCDVIRIEVFLNNIF